jgi:hypothetical protein
MLNYPQAKIIIIEVISLSKQKKLKTKVNILTTEIKID